LPFSWRASGFLQAGHTSMSRRSAGIMTCILTPLVPGANPPRQANKALR
jgi:hypothetical protein